MKCTRECDMKLVGDMLLTGRIGSLEEEKALIEYYPLIKNLPNNIQKED